MLKYRITEDVPKAQPYKPGDEVEVPAGNRSIWRDRKWAEPVGEEVETAEAVEPKKETAAPRTTKKATRKKTTRKRKKKGS